MADTDCWSTHYFFPTSTEFLFDATPELENIVTVKTEDKESEHEDDTDYDEDASSSQYYSSSFSSSEDSIECGTHIASECSTTDFDFTPDPNYKPISSGKLMSLVAGPDRHQVKDFCVLPNNILQVHQTPKEGDFIVVKLICDSAYRNNDREVFLNAVSPKYTRNTNDQVELANLKVTHFMLPGRTKGFKFAFTYTWISDGKEIERLISEPFHVWSNVNQKGYPRSSRDTLLSQRMEKNANKRRRIM